MVDGKIWSYNNTHGYGFIEQEDNGEMVFFHKKDFVRKSYIDVGMNVRYTPIMTEKGMRAKLIFEREKTWQMN